MLEKIYKSFGLNFEGTIVFSIDACINPLIVCNYLYSRLKEKDAVKAFGVKLRKLNGKLHRCMLKILEF